MQTARLTLARPRLEDLPAYDRVIGDPRVPEHQFPARFRTPEFNEQLLHKAIDHWEQHGWGPWIVWLGDELIGRAGLITSTFEGRECVEAKWFLSPDHWGRGYATEAARAAIDAGFASGLDGDPGLDDDHQPAVAGGHRAARLRADRRDRARGLPHVAFALKR